MEAYQRGSARDESRSALMREALEEVWRSCPEEHRPIVGEALREDAGQRGLGRIRRLEAERDALAGALQRFAKTLEAFEELVDEAASHSHWIPDRDNDPLDLVPIPLSDFRAARKALRFLEATLARIRRLEEALWLLEAYKNFDSRTGAATAEFLRALQREIPTIAERALSKGEAAPADHAPDAPLVMDDGLIRVLDGLTTALRQMRSMAAEAAPDRPEHELCHMLTVEIPDIAARALHEDGQHFCGGPASFGDDLDECPF